jgi:hypothetical protein
MGLLVKRTTRTVRTTTNASLAPAQMSAVIGGDFDGLNAKADVVVGKQGAQK